MKLRKGKFGLTMRSEGHKKMTLSHIDMVEGLIDDKHRLGFHQAFGYWKATDLDTGILVAEGADLKAVVTSVKGRWEAIETFRGTDQYKNIVKKVEKLRAMPGMKAGPRA